MNNTLQSLLSFVEFTIAFQNTKRSIKVKNEDRFENDAEHSYQLAMIAWYITMTQNINLDVHTIIMYALVHDLVEIYAGDTPYHNSSIDDKASKVTRESEALTRISEQFAELPELITYIKSYESRDSEEAKLVYALDKVIPVLNNYLDNGRCWHEDNISLQMVLSKQPKVAQSQYILPLWEDLVELLSTSKNLFPSK